MHTQSDSEDDFYIPVNSSLLQTQLKEIKEVSDISDLEDMEIIDSDGGEREMIGLDPTAIGLLQLNRIEAS